MHQSDPNKSKETNDLSPASDSTGIADKSGSKAIGRWTKEEHQRFTDGLKKYGKNWKLIEECVGTRSGSQIRSHAQKFFLKIGKEVDFDSIEPELPPQKKDVPEPIRKESEGSNSTNCSHPVLALELEKPEQKSLKETLELDNRIEIEPPQVIKPIQQNSLLIPMNTKSLEEMYGPGFLPSRPRRISIDYSSEKPYTNPLLEVILSKIKTNGFLPKLTDLVDTSSKSRQRAFSNYVETPIITNNFLSNNFGYNNLPPTHHNPNPRKFSEDNILIQNRLKQASHNRQNDFSEYDIITKKLKKL